MSQNDKETVYEEIARLFPHPATGDEIAQVLADNYEGGYLYFPKRLDARNRRIQAEFNGRNFRSLALKYGLSEGHVRRIVATAAPRRSRQGSLMEE